MKDYDDTIAEINRKKRDRQKQKQKARRRSNANKFSNGDPETQVSSIDVSEYEREQLEMASIMEEVCFFVLFLICEFKNLFENDYFFFLLFQFKIKSIRLENERVLKEAMEKSNSNVIDLTKENPVIDLTKDDEENIDSNPDIQTTTTSTTEKSSSSPIRPASPTAEDIKIIQQLLNEDFQPPAPGVQTSLPALNTFVSITGMLESEATRLLNQAGGDLTVRENFQLIFFLKSFRFIESA